MNKKEWIILAAFVIFGCQTLLPSTSHPPSLVPATAQNTQSPLQAGSNTSEPFVINRIKTVNGDLLPQLAVEAAKAKSLGLSPFVEFDATWCPPCKAIDASIQSSDPLTIQAFSGVYLIRADVDEWGWGDGKNFNFDAIPIYYKLNEYGLPNGEKVDGGAWNEDIPENFDPVLNAFFHGN